jgi:hypothetical protein
MIRFIACWLCVRSSSGLALSGGGGLVMVVIKQ